MKMTIYGNYNTNDWIENNWLKDAFTVNPSQTKTNDAYKTNTSYLKCYNCHGKIEYGWIYCPWCGVKL